MRRFLQVSLVFLFAVSALAQQAPPQPAKFTWIRYYTVQRGRELDFMRLAQEVTKPMMTRLMAEQKVLGWGVAVPITHDREDWTHVIYVALPDWSGAEAVGQAIEANNAKMTPADMKRMMELGSAIKEGSERDVILRHLVQSQTPPLTGAKYIVADTYWMKPGRGEDAVALFNEWGKPLFNALATRISPWGLSIQELPTSEPWTHMVWYFIDDLTARDAMETTAMSMIDPRRMQGYDVRLRDMSDVSKQRSQILRIITP